MFELKRGNEINCYKNRENVVQCYANKERIELLIFYFIQNKHVSVCERRKLKKNSLIEQQIMIMQHVNVILKIG